MDDSKPQTVPANTPERLPERQIERLVHRIERLEERIRVLEQDNGEIISLLIAIKAGLEDCVVEPADIEEDSESGDRATGGRFLH